MSHASHKGGASYALAVVLLSSCQRDFAIGDMGAPDPLTDMASWDRGGTDSALNRDLTVLDLSTSDLFTPDSGSDLSVPNLSSFCGNVSGLQKGAPWPMRGHCPTHEGRSPFVGPQTAKLKWSFTATQPVGASPAVGAGGSVYIGSEGGGTFYSIDAMSSKGIWSHALIGTVISSPAIGRDGTIYFGTDSSSVVALNSADGVTRWTFVCVQRPTS